MIKKAKKNDIEEIKPYLEEFHLDSENLDDRFFYIYKKRDILKGFGRYKNYGSYCEIASIGVLKEFRNQGIGTKLVNKLLKIIPSKEIWLTTIIPEYFIKFGFEKDNDIPESLLIKTRNICLKYKKVEKNSVFMKYKK